MADASEMNGTRSDAASHGVNKATELVGDVIETVDVSKHPDATIPTSDLSLADIERKEFKPVHWVAFTVILLIALVAPYWVGRFFAVHHTHEVMRQLSVFSFPGAAFCTWTVTVVMFTCMAMSIIETKHWFWRVPFLLSLAFEQFIAGIAMLRFDFWYSTYVVYGSSAGVFNAMDLGIIAAGVAVAVFAVLFVGLLVIIRKDSPLNVLTQGWASMILFFVIEVVALIIVLFGGLLPPME